MKKLFLSLLVVCGVAFGAMAQCTPDNSFTEAGLYPAPDSLDCFVNGEAVNTVIYFKNFDTVAGLTIQSLRVDSLTNMPCGAKYALSELDRTYDSGQAGCIAVTGTINDAAGQYKLGIYVTLTVSGLPTPISGEAGALASQFGAGDFSFTVRVKANAGDACPAVDTSASANNLIASCATIDITSVEEIANIESIKLYPNPVSNTANVSFYAANAATYNVRIVNIFGQEVANNTLNVVPGLNNNTMDVSTLSTGVYIYTITDGKAVSTHRFVVE